MGAKELMTKLRGTLGGALGALFVTLSACWGGSGSGAAPQTDAATTCHAAGALAVTNSGMSAYVIDQAQNPTLTFCRGNTYVFSVNASGHPFYINTVKGTGTANAYTAGVTGNGADVGDVTFAVPSDAPDTLFYDCSIHAAMSGTIHIID
jgi:hypothetical protein